MGQIIDGKALGQKIRAEIREQVAVLRRERGVQPGLAVVLVGDNPASQVYVRNKTKACEEVGIAGFQHTLPADTQADTLLSLVERLNKDPQIHGILVQLPLPEAFKKIDIVTHVDPRKDVDGLHPLNLGNLATGRECFRSCTPFGVMKILESIGFDLEGKQAVVLGRSNIVGKPMGLMLLEKNATVTFCHSRTPNLGAKVREADLLVAAVGVPELVKADWIKPGAVVIDVGINRLPDKRLVGDVEFAPVLEKAAYVTPVPGGVGPMTIAMLLWNTLQAARRSMMDTSEA
ncbi:MAG TPA: bifunctional methylenetetrahydrofolate dehydrogenase/methenyltetrahydrofolate cyclohydrolase FolD [Deltaproteobacteria bacterium]|nr:bifunctional methylenetetrahydrofolate dehydrogenase/methenyltetrahydrofolate cyclohydrolase FolD [Deltaproteobacteria bacterium]